MITPFLLRRYLVPREGNLLSFVLWISVFGVALGIAVLILVLGVMSGFQGVLAERYTRITSDLVILPRQNSTKKVDFEDVLRKDSRIEAFAPFRLGQGMLFANGVGGAVLEGIDPESFGRVTPLKHVFYSGPDQGIQRNNVHWIWLGKGLADKLKVGVGDEISVMLNEGAKGTVQFRISAITKFGIFDHDMRYAYISLPLLTHYFQKAAYPPMFKVKVKDREALPYTAESLREKMGSAAQLKLWTDLNQNIFMAVAHQKKMLFVVLEIIVALAGVNVINLLMMSTHYRRRDTAILRAMGIRLRSVLFFFVAQGACVGLIGVLSGVGLGLLFAEGLKRWQPEILSESVYNVTRLPIHVAPDDILLICAVAFVLCIVFSVIPAVRAAYARPVQSLRMD